MDFVTRIVKCNVGSAFSNGLDVGMSCTWTELAFQPVSFQNMTATSTDTHSAQKYGCQLARTPSAGIQGSFGRPV